MMSSNEHARRIIVSIKVGVMPSNIMHTLFIYLFFRIIYIFPYLSATGSNFHVNFAFFKELTAWDRVHNLQAAVGTAFQLHTIESALGSSTSCVCRYTLSSID